MMNLSNIRSWVFEQKYRFDWGQQLLALTNFTLLVITASDKLKAALGLPLTSAQVVMIFVPLGFIGIWCFGFVLDKLKSPRAYEVQNLKRSKQYEEFCGLREDVKEIKEMLKHD